ncbi:MAG: hypothetical protein IJD46_00915 [Bacilli bacterium]|nr:hypothetical protein [Bacilli bacterium]
MNYEELINGLKVESIIKMMKKLGADKYIEKPGCIIFPTICHNIDSSSASMKLYFYTDRKLFVCYSEDGTMSIFKFLKTYYETRNIEYDWYEDIYNVVLNCGDYSIKENFTVTPYTSLREKYQPRKTRKELEYYAPGIMEVFTKQYPVEWLNDGISKESMNLYGIKYSISQNKIIIPHYDIKGRLIGIRGRALNEWEIENVGKYLPIQIEGKWYKHPLSLNLYGLNISKENIRRYGICYVGEAEKFCLQMAGFNIPNCSCSVCGSSFNKYQLDLLMRFCQPREIVLCFDKEEKKGEDKYFNKLYEMGKKYKNYCLMSFIYDREGLLDLKDSPTDKGEKIFKKLLERRVFIK